jgi:two-component system, chemotaxis family, protein-glutamate methylesterase/glutaminase
MLKVLVADDSYFIRTSIAKALKTDPGIEAFTAKDYYDILDKIKIKPDVVILSIDMPEISGLDILFWLIKKNPVPVIVMAFAEDLSGSDALTAIKYGAVDVIEKPRIPERIFEIKDRLIGLVKSAAQLEIKSILYPEQEPIISPDHSTKAIVIGASSGGPPAIEHILEALPENFPCPIFIVQHLPQGFANIFVKRLGNNCKLKVKLIEDGQYVNGGTIFVLPRGKKIEFIDKDGLVLKVSKSISSPSPSIDQTLIAASDKYKENLISVILTGFGNDGSMGIKHVKENKGLAIVQDEKTSSVAGMPKNAIGSGCADFILPLDKISRKIVELI